jgi:hypothetical protein
MTTQTIPSGPMVSIAQYQLDYLKNIREAAGTANSKMFEVLTLIHAIFDLQSAADETGLTDAPGLTDRTSRMESLLIMAQDKTAAALDALSL